MGLRWVLEDLLAHFFLNQIYLNELTLLATSASAILQQDPIAIKFPLFSACPISKNLKYQIWLWWFRQPLYETLLRQGSQPFGLTKVDPLFQA